MVRAKVWTEYWLHTGDKVGNLLRRVLMCGITSVCTGKLPVQPLCRRQFAGSERLLFYLGGVDNWFRPTFNITTSPCCILKLTATKPGHRYARFYTKYTQMEIIFCFTTPSFGFLLYVTLLITPLRSDF